MSSKEFSLQDLAYEYITNERKHLSNDNERENNV